MNDSEARTFARVYDASAEESVVDRVEHATRITNEVKRVRGAVESPPYCRANVAPASFGGYTPCMKILPCPIHGDNPSYREE